MSETELEGPTFPSWAKAGLGSLGGVGIVLILLLSKKARHDAIRAVMRIIHMPGNFLPVTAMNWSALLRIVPSRVVYIDNSKKGTFSNEIFDASDAEHFHSHERNSVRLGVTACHRERRHHAHDFQSGLSALEPNIAVPAGRGDGSSPRRGFPYWMFDWTASRFNYVSVDNGNYVTVNGQRISDK